MARNGTGPDDRWSGLVLAGLAVSALAVGAGWWVSAAPEGLSGPVTPSAISGPASPSAISRIFHAPPGSGVSIEIDPATGRMVVPPGSRAVDELPGVTNTLLRAGATLDEGGSRSWRLPTPDGDRYLLQYVCSGPGEVRVEVAGARRGPGRTAADCSATFSTVEVVAGGELTLTVRRLHPGSAEVGVQLVGLP